MAVRQQKTTLILTIAFFALASGVGSNANSIAASTKQSLPYDFQLTNFQERQSDYEGFDWTATLKNLGPGVARIPWLMALSESTSEDFSTGPIVSYDEIVRIDGKSEKFLQAGDSIEITNEKNTHAVGLVARFTHTPTYVKIEIDPDSSSNALLNPPNPKRKPLSQGPGETNYANNVSNTIVVKREKYATKPPCIEEETEENDSITSATLIKTGIEYISILCMDDRDLFRINLTGGMQYELLFVKAPTTGRVVLFDPKNRMVFDELPLVIERLNRKLRFKAPVSGKYTLVYTRSRMVLAHVRESIHFKIVNDFK